jgi:hypothetical protein
MKTKTLKMIMGGMVAGAFLLSVLPAHADGNSQIKAAKKYLRKTSAAEMPAQAQAFISQARPEDRVAAYEAIRQLYPQQAAAMSIKPPPRSGPFQPGSPTGIQNRPQTVIVLPGEGRIYSKP